MPVAQPCQAAKLRDPRWPRYRRPADAANGPYLATPGPTTATGTVATAISLTDNTPTISFGGGAAIPGNFCTQPISVPANSNDVNGNDVCPELRSGELPIIA